MNYLCLELLKFQQYSIFILLKLPCSVKMIKYSQSKENFKYAGLTTILKFVLTTIIKSVFKTIIKSVLTTIIKSVLTTN
jgi:hypothetical protein